MASGSTSKRVYLCFKKDEEVTNYITHVFLVFFELVPRYDVFAFEVDEMSKLQTALTYTSSSNHTFYRTYTILPVTYSSSIYDEMYGLHKELQATIENAPIVKNTAVYIKSLINAIKSEHGEEEIDIESCTPQTLYDKFILLLQSKEVTVIQEKPLLRRAFEWLHGYFVKDNPVVENKFEEV